MDETLNVQGLKPCPMLDEAMCEANLNAVLNGGWRDVMKELPDWFEVCKQRREPK
jgi:hypothetical protein